VLYLKMSNEICYPAKIIALTRQWLTRHISRKPRLCRVVPHENRGAWRVWLCLYPV